jgi:hypothetical protein
MPSSAAAAGGGAQAITTEEDETLKRNTDCVYFLASPLTCKKVTFYGFLYFFMTWVFVGFVYCVRSLMLFLILGIFDLGIL